jgi:hypothetical protein
MGPIAGIGDMEKRKSLVLIGIELLFSMSSPQSSRSKRVSYSSPVFGFTEYKLHLMYCPHPKTRMNIYFLSSKSVSIARRQTRMVRSRCVAQL